MPTLPDRVLFGAAYYHEYRQPRQPGRLDEDLDLMLAAGFSVIRVGESVWSTWEPDNGRFDLDWLEPVLDGAERRGIRVVLGTPTYAVPPWLARLYPEIAGERATGQRIPWGARQEADITHPAFRFHAERVIRKIMARYAAHPAVTGFQVDNEPGLLLLHNHGVFQRFVDHLRHTYGDVETLNEAWGLVYWSHRLATWADLWTPDGNAQPQYALAWRRFQAEQVTDYIGWQADLVREYARPDQFITTCISYDRPAVEDDALTRQLDITSGNPYYAMQDELAVPQLSIATPRWPAHGTWALYQSADRMFSSRQEPFLVTETNAQTIGPSWLNQPAYEGQHRQAAWALVSRGARMIEYWHWHTLPFGAETFWGGVLPHSGRPGRTYREIARLGGEFTRAAGLVAGLTPDADVAMLYSSPSKWLQQFSPELTTSDGKPDPRSYHVFFDAFYRAAFEAGRQVRIVQTAQLGTSPAALAARHPVLIVPCLYVSTDATLELLLAYAAAGGHLVLGPRSTVLDHEARARPDVLPARLAAAAGAWYEESSNHAAVTVRVPDGSPLAVPTAREPRDRPTVASQTPQTPTWTATRWIDGLMPEDCEVLAGYDHPHFGRFAAVTSRRHGEGRITLVGSVPDGGLGRSLLEWLAPVPSVPPWVTSSSSVTATGATAADGRRVHFLHNWSWEATTVRVPVGVRDALDGTIELAPGDDVELRAWDVRIFHEAPRR